MILLYTEKGLKLIRDYSFEAYRFAKTFFAEHRSDGTYNLSDGTVANVMTYVTRPAALTCYESHRKNIDIQYLIYGEELMIVEDVAKLAENVYKEYDNEKDCVLYNYENGEVKILKAGDIVVLNPNDGHRGAIAISTPIAVRKMVFKVPLRNNQNNSNI